MAKDVNIHVKAPGADKTKRDLDKIADSSWKVGGQTAKAQEKASAATEKTTHSMGRMGKTLGALKVQVTAFIGAWLGLQSVKKLVDWLIEKLERIARLQEDIYQKSLGFGVVGQALEFQTSTKGRQQYWSSQAATLQKAGGLPSLEVAQQMLVSMDIAFAAQGGIKSPEVLGIAGQLAPFVGAALLGPEEVAKLFEFAGTAGVAPTAEAYKQFFAQLHAGYTSGKPTKFGQFMMGLQKGGTAYMSMGGSLPEAISAFTAARAVMPNEAVAATLLEQAARLSGGGYEGPRTAMEQALGVKWDQLTMDQRLGALLQYTAGIPESQRGQVLAEQGFPLELTTQIGKMVSPEATRAMALTRRRVAGASLQTVDELGSSYLGSPLGVQRQVEGQISLGVIETGPQFADWQARIKKARAEHELLVAKGEDSWVIDRLEPYVMTLESLLEEAGKIPMESLSESDRERLRRLKGEIFISKVNMSNVVSPLYPAGLAARVGYGYTNELREIQEIHYHNNEMNYFPVAGSAADREEGPRNGPDFRH